VISTLSQGQGEACERQRSDREERTHLDAFPGVSIGSRVGRAKRRTAVRKAGAASGRPYPV
jgi:hypothetical protein